MVDNLLLLDLHITNKADNIAGFLLAFIESVKNQKIENLFAD